MHVVCCAPSLALRLQFIGNVACESSVESGESGGCGGAESKRNILVQLHAVAPIWVAHKKKSYKWADKWMQADTPTHTDPHHYTDGLACDRGEAGKQARLMDASNSSDNMTCDVANLKCVACLPTWRHRTPDISGILHKIYKEQAKKEWNNVGRIKHAASE